MCVRRSSRGCRGWGHEAAREVGNGGFVGKGQQRLQRKGQQRLQGKGQQRLHGKGGRGCTGRGGRDRARVGEGTTVASKVEGEAVAGAAGRAIARPVGAAGAAANAGKHTAGPAETAKGASSKAAAGGVGSEDIGATGEGEVSVVPTGVGTEEGDVIAIEEDEGEDVMHIDGPLAQYLTPDGEADPAPLQPHVEVPPLPPMPVPMLAEGPMEGLGETLRTEPHEGAQSSPPVLQPTHPQEHDFPTPTLRSRRSTGRARGPSTPTSNPPSRPDSPRVAPLGSHHPYTQPARSVPTEGDVSRRGDALRAPPLANHHPPSTHPFGPTAPPSFTNGADNQVGPHGGRIGAEEAEGQPTPTPNLHSRPAPAPPQGHGERTSPITPPFWPPLRAVSPSQVAAAAIATGMEAVGQVFETPEEVGLAFQICWRYTARAALRAAPTLPVATGPDPDVCGGHPVCPLLLIPHRHSARRVTPPDPNGDGPASTPVPVRGPALSCATPPLSSLTPPMHGAGESSPPLIPGDPLGAQAAHGVPSTASSDATAPIDPADTATSPDQVVSCPTCRSSLANRRALQHHIPFCHPADCGSQGAGCPGQPPRSSLPSHSPVRPGYSSPTHSGRRSTRWTGQSTSRPSVSMHALSDVVPERVRGGYLDVLSAILVRIAQDPEAAGPTFLLAAAPTLFLVPATPPDRSHTAAIATRISRFGRGEWAELVSDALGRRTPLPRRTGHRSRTATDPSTADERRIARCLRLAACNETSRACAALESAEAAPDTQGTIQRLQSKHPNAERPTPAWQSGFQGSPSRALARSFSADPFHRPLYGTPSDLHYRSGTGVVTMHSERGTRQGDPLSPFLYALTQRLALEPVLVEGDVQLWSYADDTYVLGPPDRVLHHFAEIVRRLGEMGLAAQPHKCLVYQTESFLSRDLEAFTGLGDRGRTPRAHRDRRTDRHRFVRGAESPGSSREDGAGATLASEVAPAPDSCPPSVGVCQHSSAVPVEDRPSFARSDL
ncbi:unnamed protein product [Closterium sp. NIES-65]|nr:unnamed protein product [Closterium sp. NIES-65]